MDHLPERRPRKLLFARAVEYRTYRLPEVCPWYLNARQHEKLFDLKKQIGRVMTADKFAGRYRILVLNFVYSLKQSCDDRNAAEDVDHLLAAPEPRNGLGVVRRFSQLSVNESRIQRDRGNVRASSSGGGASISGRVR